MHGWDSGQKYRANSGRWANSGGKLKKEYDMYYYREQQNPFFHPKSSWGYWSLIASGLTDADARAQEPCFEA